MELSIDTASELASVALSREGSLVRDIAWRCERNHTVELLPTIEQLLNEAGVQKANLTAVFLSVAARVYTGLCGGLSAGAGLSGALWRSAPLGARVAHFLYTHP